MADNYLENRFQQVFEQQHTKVVHKGGPGLDSLLKRTRGLLCKEQQGRVDEQSLRKIAAVNTFVLSEGNSQRLRFGLRESSREGEPGRILIACAGESDSAVMTDCGMAVLAMMLKATELGFGSEFSPSPFEAPQGMSPLGSLSIGRSVQKVFLIPGAEEASEVYFQEDTAFEKRLSLEKLCF